jgi:hypothetical protein
VAQRFATDENSQHPGSAFEEADNLAEGFMVFKYVPEVLPGLRVIRACVCPGTSVLGWDGMKPGLCLRAMTARGPPRPSCMAKQKIAGAHLQDTVGVAQESAACRLGSLGPGTLTLGKQF